MIPLPATKKNLVFSCKHETIPDPLPETDTLFKYARWLQKNNQLKEDPVVNFEIERLYRVAAENGHFKANVNLQNGALRGVFSLAGYEHLRMSQKLIDANVASGYFFVGIFLKHGIAGIYPDQEMAQRYFRKSADEGNAQAQRDVGAKLAPIDIAPDIARQMRKCAADQGHGAAATTLGVDLSTDGHFREAMQAYQLGVAAGDSLSASFMSKGFRGPTAQNRMYYLDQMVDLERADRYQSISRILAKYSYANPTVLEINDIVPLPPAKLPEWDGKLQWLEAHLANVAPDKPSEALITRLAEAKGLDPLTGKPLPGSPAFSQEDLYPRRSYTGELCPTSGYWTNIELFRECTVDGPIARYIEKAEVMPPLLMRHYKRRHWPWSDKITEYVEPVEWKLI